MPNMVQMVVAHYCHHFGFHAPHPLWCKWWSNTITMTLVPIHHTQYGPDGGHTLLPSFWFPCTIPTMAQMVVKHHCHILVLTHHSSHAQDGGHTPLPSFWFPCTIPTMAQMVVKHHCHILVLTHHSSHAQDGGHHHCHLSGFHAPYLLWLRW